MDYTYLNDLPQVRDIFLSSKAGETPNDSQTNSAIMNKLDCIQNQILIEKDGCKFQSILLKKGMLTGKSYGEQKLLMELIQGSTFLEIAKEPHSL